MKPVIAIPGAERVEPSPSPYSRTFSLSLSDAAFIRALWIGVYQACVRPAVIRHA